MNIYLLCLGRRMPKNVGEKILEIVNTIPDTTEYNAGLRKYFGIKLFSKVPPTVKNLMDNRIILVFMLAKRLNIKIPRPIRNIIYKKYSNDFYNLALNEDNYESTVKAICVNKDTSFAFKLRHNSGTIIKFISEGVNIEKFFILDHVKMPHYNTVYRAVVNSGNVSNMRLVIDKSYVASHQKMMLSFKCGSCILVEKHTLVFNDINQKIIKWICQGNYLDCMLFILRLGFDNYNVSHTAWSFGSLEMIRLLAKWGALRYGNSTEMVCRRGNLDLVKFLIGQGAFNFTLGFTTACHSHNHNIVGYLLDLGIVKSVDVEIIFSWHMRDIRLFDQLVWTASHSALVQIGMQACGTSDLCIMKKICTYRAIDINRFFCQACRISSLEFVKYFGKFNLNWNAPIYEVCRKGRLTVFTYLLEKGATNLEEALQGAIAGGQNQMCSFILQIKN